MKSMLKNGGYTLFVSTYFMYLELQEMRDYLYQMATFREEQLRVSQKNVVTP